MANPIPAMRISRMIEELLEIQKERGDVLVVMRSEEDGEYCHEDVKVQSSVLRGRSGSIIGAAIISSAVTE